MSTKELIQSTSFQKWVLNLKDKRARTAIAARLYRLANDLPGDVASVGEGISELRIHYGPGYRIYYRQYDHSILLILCGGNKSSQTNDIAIARMLAKTWKEQEDEWNIYNI
ncbi:MAG TPA: type II toxin-antitoxin system RelE/ParE family toxin [Buttiauxella sp.]|uniref:type II toxin-antitoxin system RelE/ParE family toxin n=1 Tax=Buttiauxella sp. TaxID=1972222 RepID=UPI002B465B9C|nr:type II toxin-antitoxin system RelE/ParE family toxin [Buttiauxella sp.]HKM96033.1 type II toxin-antitoxin system RelE/ParE family toxin [Buttiauxella sp.]